MKLKNIKLSKKVAVTGIIVTLGLIGYVTSINTFGKDNETNETTVRYEESVLLSQVNPTQIVELSKQSEKTTENNDVIPDELEKIENEKEPDILEIKAQENVNEHQKVRVEATTETVAETETTEPVAEPTVTPVTTASNTDASQNTSSPYENHLNAYDGTFEGPSGHETYYNLDMSGVVSIMRSNGYSEEEYPYWIRNDGVKMFGPYVIVAANLDIRPKGTILECSMGTAIVCDTGGFAAGNPYQLDVAVTW